jgi:hypothetical protein
MFFLIKIRCLTLISLEFPRLNFMLIHKHFIYLLFFLQILESSQTLLNVLKRESHTLKDKGGQITRVHSQVSRNSKEINVKHLILIKKNPLIGKLKKSTGDSN